MSTGSAWAAAFAVVYGLICVVAFVDLWKSQEIGTHRWRTLVLLVGYKPPMGLFRYVILIALPIYWIVWRVRQPGRWTDSAAATSSTDSDPQVSA